MPNLDPKTIQALKQFLNQVEKPEKKPKKLTDKQQSEKDVKAYCALLVNV